MADQLVRGLSSIKVKVVRHLVWIMWKILLPLVGIWEPKKLVVLAFQELHLQNKS